MVIEIAKTYKLIKMGLINFVRSRVPTRELSDEQIEKIISELVTKCKMEEELIRFAGCIYSNVQRVIEKYR